MLHPKADVLAFKSPMAKTNTATQSEPRQKRVYTKHAFQSLQVGDSLTCVPAPGEAPERTKARIYMASYFAGKRLGASFKVELKDGTVTCKRVS
jgi:hypothetical protein